MSDTESQPNSELDPIVCQLVEELTERINRGEQVNFREIVALHPERAEQLDQILPTLQLFCDVGVTAARHAFAIPSLTSAADPFSQTLGDFRLVRQIGRGGMGVVYEAEQISLDRRVAIKVLPFAGVLDERHLQRFKNEARAAAGLTHPHIVPVYAVGSERGIHYYAMQYINGRSFAEIFRDNLADNYPLTKAHGLEKTIGPLPGQSRNCGQSPPPEDTAEGRNAPDAVVAEKLPVESGRFLKSNEHQAAVGCAEPSKASSATTAEMFDSSTFSNDLQTIRKIAEWGAQIAEALDYAHSTGIVHRDIKPANLMLDSQGHVWITDFGLAQLDFGAGPTMTGEIIGTLRYMSPEQATGERGLLDQRTDVYSLGVTLYELLAGKPLFSGTDRVNLIHKILHEDPSTIRSINPKVPRDLATIVHKSMERELSPRYQTAADLAADLRRFLNERPIRARPPTVSDRLRKWCRRNQTLVRLAFAFSFLSIIAIAGATLLIQYERAQAALLIKHEREQATLERRARRAQQELASSNRKAVANNQYVAHINLADHAWRTGRSDVALQQLERCEPVHDSDELRGFEWHYLSQSVRKAPITYGSHQGDAYCSNLPPDGRTLATGGLDGVRLWNFHTGERVGHLTDHGTDVNSVSFSPDGKWLATASDDHSVKIWSTKSWTCVQTIAHEGHVVSAQFSPDSHLLATAERNQHWPFEQIGKNVVRFWNTRTWEREGNDLSGHTFLLQSMVFNPDGTLLATASSDGLACIWNVATRTEQSRLIHRLVVGDGVEVKGVAFAHHSPLLVTVGTLQDSGSVHLWSTIDGSRIADMGSRITGLEWASFSPDDSLIAGGGGESRVYLWQRQGDGTYSFRESHETTSGLWSINFVGERSIVTTARDGNVLRRELLSRPIERRILCPSIPTPIVAFHPEGELMAIAAQRLDIYHIAGSGKLIHIEPIESQTVALAFAPNGETLATGNAHGTIRFFDFKGGIPSPTSRELSVEFFPSRLKFLSQKGLLEVALFGGPHRVAYCDPVMARIVPPPTEIGNLIRNLRSDFVFSPDGRTHATATGEGTIDVWQGERLLWHIDGLGSAGSSLEFSNDGRHAAICRQDGLIQVWEVAAPQTQNTFVGKSGRRALLAFSADGRTLAGIFDDGTIKLWNIATGGELVTLDSKLVSSMPRTLQMAPVGNTLVASGTNQQGQSEVVVWHLPADSAVKRDKPLVTRP